MGFECPKTQKSTVGINKNIATYAMPVPSPEGEMLRSVLNEYSTYIAPSASSPSSPGNMHARCPRKRATYSRGRLSKFKEGLFLHRQFDTMKEHKTASNLPHGGTMRGHRVDVPLHQPLIIVLLSSCIHKRREQPTG